MANRWGNSEKVTDFIFLGSRITEDSDCSHEIKRLLLLERKAMMNLDSILKSRDITLLAEVCIVETVGFPVAMYEWELDHKEGWAPKNWCFELWCLRRLLRVILDCKEIKPVNPKGNQFWIFIGRTDVKTEAWILYPPDVKSQLIGKDPAAGKDWERRGQQRMRWLDGITDSKDMLWANSRRLRTGKPSMLQSFGSQRVRHDWVTEQQLTSTVTFPLLRGRKLMSSLSSFNGHRLGARYARVWVLHFPLRKVDNIVKLSEISFLCLLAKYNYPPTVVVKIRKCCVI